MAALRKGLVQRSYVNRPAHGIPDHSTRHVRAVFKVHSDDDARIFPMRGQIRAKVVVISPDSVIHVAACVVQ